jgi:D-glycero-D-manno-heptose 1,7-bisphosphate phosphatase
MTRRAVFLDRDGTIIEDPGYLSDPEQVKLLPGVDLAIKSLRQAGYAIVVVTNQSGVARGMLTEERLAAIHKTLRAKLADKNAPLDAIYYCPFHPEGTVAEFASESDHRKPAPGMLLTAAAEMGLDLAGSWMVGDSPRDVSAGQRAGCRTVRILHPDTRPPELKSPDQEEFQPDATVRNLVEAARIILREAPREPGRADSPNAPAEASADDLPPTPAEADEAQADEPVAAVESDEPVESVEATEAPSPEPVASPAERQPYNPDDSTVRREILQYVRQMSRQAETEEFSISNLIGGIAQAVTLMFVLLALLMHFTYDDTQQAVLWALLGVIFQCMSLTFFTMSGKK